MDYEPDWSQNEQIQPSQEPRLLARAGAPLTELLNAKLLSCFILFIALHCSNITTHSIFQVSHSNSNWSSDSSYTWSWDSMPAWLLCCSQIESVQGGSCCFTMLLCCCMLLCCSQLAGSSKSDSSRSLQQKLFHHAAAICSMLHATAHYSLSIFTAQSCSKLFSLVAMLHHSHNRAVFLFSIGQLFIFNYLLKLLMLLNNSVLTFRPNFHWGSSVLAWVSVFRQQ